MAKKQVIVTEVLIRLQPEEDYVMIVPNVCSGAKGRYTVLKVPACEGRRIKIIGRELSLRQARQVANGTYKKGKAGDEDKGT